MADSPQNLPAKAASLLLHPVFIPLWYLLYAYPLTEEFYTLHLFAALFLVIFPGIVTGIWLKVKREKDPFVVSRDNRGVPLASIFFGGFLFAISCGPTLKSDNFPVLLLLIVMGLALMALLITFFWKISLHSIGWGTVCGWIAATQFHYWVSDVAIHGDVANVAPLWLLIPAVIASAVVFWARHVLGSHDWRQMFAGWWLGFLVPAIGIWWVAERTWESLPW